MLITPDFYKLISDKIFSAAENFAILRSIIDTAIKNNQNVLQALNVIAEYKRDWFILKILTLGILGTPNSRHWLVTKTLITTNLTLYFQNIKFSVISREYL